MSVKGPLFSQVVRPTFLKSHFQFSISFVSLVYMWQDLEHARQASQLSSKEFNPGSKGVGTTKNVQAVKATAAHRNNTDPLALIVI